MAFSMLSVTVFVLLLISTYRLVWRQFLAQQDCEMTYMYEWPQYQMVPLESEVEQKYPQYSLHLYSEGAPANSITSPKVNGIPVLFLPGNAGSYKQGRSTGSIALRMYPQEFSYKRHFDVFTVNFDEELSGMFGGVLQRQTEFLTICIDHILSLYKHVRVRPKSVIIIGHSMGGVIARGLFVDPMFDDSRVSTIIALSSPLVSPVLGFDRMLHYYYKEVGKVWSDSERNLSSKVTIVSISGGLRDVMVPSYLSVIPSSLAMASPAIPRNWASADHLAVVWCRRVQLALTRSLFILQDKSQAGLTGDIARREAVFHHILDRGHLVPFNSTATSKVKKRRVLFSEPMAELTASNFSSSNLMYAAFPLSADDHTHSVVASNTESTSWVYLCSEFNSSSEFLFCSDLSSQARLLPPKDKVMKYVQLSASDVTKLGFSRENHTHLLVVRPASSKDNVVSHHCQLSSSPLSLPWFKSKVTLPAGHCPLTKLPLDGFGSMWQSYSAAVTSSCGGVAGGLVTPWYPHHALQHETTTLSGSASIVLDLNILVPPTPEAKKEQAYLLLWSRAECELMLEVTAAPLLLLDKLTLLYAPLLLPWMTAACITASCRSLHWEVLAISLLCLATRFNWVQPTSWFGSEPLWSGCAPLVVHLVSCGIQHFLYLSVTVVTDILGWCFRRGRSVFSWCLILVGGATCLGMCSGLGFAVAFVGYLLRSQGSGSMVPVLREVACVLFCLQVLLLPALFTWARSLGSSLRLNPDPHVVTSMTAIILIAFLLYTSPAPIPAVPTPATPTSPAVASDDKSSDTINSSHPTIKDDTRKGSSKALYVRAMYLSLGVAVITVCMSQAYRMVVPVSLYLITTAIHLSSHP